MSDHPGTAHCEDCGAIFSMEEARTGKCVDCSAEQPAQSEGYPADWARVVLMVSPDGNQFHAIGGDREPGEGDTAYIGRERLISHINNTTPAALPDAARKELVEDLKRHFEFLREAAGKNVAVSAGPSNNDLVATIGKAIAALSQGEGE